MTGRVGARMNMESVTVADLVSWGERALAEAAVVCAHGTTTCRDEAAAILYHQLGLDHADAGCYGRPVNDAERLRFEAAIRRRIVERMPAPYLLGEAWFGGRPYYVDRRVLIPRSPFAGLIAARFEPWLAHRTGLRILEIGTGSGCIAIACALEFPDSFVLATDLSFDALMVARRNAARHGVTDRVQFVNADLLRGLRGRFDLLISNPPYVPEAQLRDAPPELAWEPRQALAGGADGLSLVRLIVRGAARLLEPWGWLAIEVGAGMAALEQAFPRTPFIWPELESGDGIALVAAGDLAVDNDVLGRERPGT